MGSFAPCPLTIMLHGSQVCVCVKVCVCVHGNWLKLVVAMGVVYCKRCITSKQIHMWLCRKMQQVWFPITHVCIHVFYFVSLISTPTVDIIKVICYISVLLAIGQNVWMKGGKGLDNMVKWEETKNFLQWALTIYTPSDMSYLCTDHFTKV